MDAQRRLVCRRSTQLKTVTGSTVVNLWPHSRSVRIEHVLADSTDDGDEPRERNRHLKAWA